MGGWIVVWITFKRSWRKHLTSVDGSIVEFNKRYGRDILAKSVDDPARIPTGIFPIDLAMGGGFPVGRFSVIYGMEGSLKSTLALLAMASSQRIHPDKVCVVFDLENTFSGSWAEGLGVNVSRIKVIRPETAEQAVDMIVALLCADDIGVIMVDSLAALATSAEINSSAETTIVGVSSRLVNRLYRTAGHALTEAGEAGNTPTLLLLNQIRYKIGVMFGNPEVQPGGPSFKFASSMTLRLYAKDIMDSDISKDLPAFKQTTVTVQKWKVPIIARKVDKLQIALLPNDKYGLKIGESYDFPTIVTYLKHLELFDKADKDWRLTLPDTGETIDYRVQDDFKKQLREDPLFAHRVKDIIITNSMRINDD